MKTILLTGLAKTNLKAKKIIEASKHKAQTLTLQEIKALPNRKFSQENYDWLILTSTTAAEIFFEVNQQEKIQFTNIAAVGPSTAKTIESYGHKVQLLPEKIYSAKSLVKHFPQGNGQSALYPCSQLSDDHIEQELPLKGYKVDRIDLYAPRELANQELPFFTDVIFFSSSSVDIFAKNYGRNVLKNKNAVAIGSSTATAFVNNFGFEPTLPEESTVQGAVKSLL